MSTNANEQPTFTIPTVDLTAYLNEPESSEAENIVTQIRTACTTIGFFQITGHGVPESLQKRVFAAAKALFGLPDDEKQKLRGKPGRGFELIGAQTLEDGKKPDLKEGWYVGREMPGNKPPFRPFQEANIWPHQLLDSEFKQPLLEYHRALSELSFLLMRILARGLKNFDTTVFEDFCRDPIAAIRLLHYPPHPKSDDSALVGAGAHTDFGAITLLLQDGHSGLQVLNQFTGEWINVPPQEHAYVVNVGDMLEAWTSGAYKSNVHRVINTSGTDRYSIPFFLDGNADCIIKPLDGSEGKAFTVEEHMLSRYAASYKS
ncbi:uncharacterized protein Z520_02155 [Fonsecaea multimorphosa CBS 102226]|uniref:Fe2OG dioxygenase domain-containing protein n=1 Tax=Fonsecaea multimorphosa CBS 102226 TaxID=1442371 RepID=A0A0D2IY94_9EURO|nr:uncharacterized protein Z520_02155 [Fonsecaea multimorphosa CBS 102226]KIY02017.1 hypothetical protein Z520_02155 [Fonsecaea multimorphosa CBS 102226]OAL29699.1 hypothetical protein AYO22_02113 [Fonsecaea multimorphosa]